MSQHSNSGQRWIAVGAVFGFLAVTLGAMGAHWLGDSGYLIDRHGTVTKHISGMDLPAAYKYLGDFQTGVRYHMYHALALIGVGLFALSYPGRTIHAAGWCFAAGIVLFSGSLYVLVIAGPKWLGITWGMVAPIGGLLQMAGWLLFACAAWSRIQPVRKDSVSK